MTGKEIGLAKFWLPHNDARANVGLGEILHC